MTVRLKPFEQKREFIPVFISSTASATAQTIKLDLDDNLGPGYYVLSIIGTEHNYKSTATTIKVAPYANAAQTIAAPPLWLCGVDATTATTSYSLATVNATVGDSATGYYVNLAAVQSGTTLVLQDGAQSMSSRGVFVPYGLKVTLTNNVSSTIQLDLMAQRLG